MDIDDIFEEELGEVVSPRTLAAKYIDETRKYRRRGHTFKAIFKVIMKIEGEPDVRYESWHRAVKKELSRTHKSQQVRSPTVEDFRQSEGQDVNQAGSQPIVKADTMTLGQPAPLLTSQPPLLGS